MFANRMHNLHIIYAAPYTINRYHDRLFRFGWMTNKILSENFLPLHLLHRSSLSASNGTTDKFGILSETNNARSCLIGLCSLIFIAFGRASQSGREKFAGCESIVSVVPQNGNTNKLAHNTWISTQSTGEAQLFAFHFAWFLWQFVFWRQRLFSHYYYFRLQHTPTINFRCHSLDTMTMCMSECVPS